MSGFTAVCGDWGSGKTLLLSRMGYDRAMQGEKVIANYHVNFPHTYMSYQEFVKSATDGFPHDEIRNAFILWDEAAMGADAYEFLEMPAKQIMMIVTQLRKFDAEITFTVQRFNWIIRRMRQVTNRYFLMKDLDAELFDHRRYKCGLQFEITILNKYQEFAGRKLWDGTKSVGLELYDTRERIGKVKV